MPPACACMHCCLDCCCACLPAARTQALTLAGGDFNEMYPEYKEWWRRKGR